MTTVLPSGGAVARLTTDRYQLEVLVDRGPRVTHFSLGDGANVLAELPDRFIQLADGNRFSFVGGHRLWVGPEIPERTYLSDDEPCLVESSRGLIIATQPPHPSLPIERTVQLEAGRRGVRITHTLRNVGDRPESVAPWAITQLRQGGTAVLPLETSRADSHGLQANRTIAAWPYTDLSRVQFVGDLALLAGPHEDPIKIGLPLNRGWLAYVLDEAVFVKRSTHDPTALYQDRGASGQVYGEPDFTELETVGPVVSLEAGAETTHVEWWELHPRSLRHEVVEIIERLELDGP